MSEVEPNGHLVAVVVDDEPDVRGLIRQILVSAGYRVVEAPAGLEGIAAVREHRPDLVTLDVNMPGIDGFETARRIRLFSDAYVILITALSDETDIVLGFAAGADDVVIKPFRVRELRARLDAVIRRSRTAALDTDPQDGVDGKPTADTAADAGAPPRSAPPPSRVSAPVEPETGHTDRMSSDTLTHGGLVIEVSHRTAELDGQHLTLTRTEFDLLVLLLRSEGKVRSRSDLVLAVRDEGYLGVGTVTDADEHAISSHITNLRRKLGETGTLPRFIATVRGVGYRATPPPGTLPTL